MEKQSGASTSKRATGWFAGAGVLTGFFALLGASCCILPLVLVNIGMGSAFAANLGPLARWREPLIGVTALLLLAALIFAFRGGRRPRARFWISIGVASLLLATAWQRPQHELEILRWLGLI